jgi:hypothetical protein
MLIEVLFAAVTTKSQYPIADCATEHSSLEDLPQMDLGKEWFWGKEGFG